MKNYYLLLFKTFLILSFFLTQLNAQESSCGTVDFAPNPIKEKFLSSLNASGPFYVKIYPHVVRKNDGSGGQPFSGVMEALSYLDSDYEPLNIFFVWDGCIDYIDSTALFNFPNTSLFEINPHDDGIDIYLLDDDTGVVGTSTAPFQPNQTRTAFMIGGTDDGITVAKSHAVSHEMGHSFNLYHTWRGCGTNFLEALDGSNCETAGDLVCDTPADPGLANDFVNTSCEWDKAFFQLGGQDLYAACQQAFFGPIPNDIIRTYQPQLNNIMNNYRPICYEFFTPGQGQRMRNALAGVPILQPALRTGPSTQRSTCFCTEEPDIFISDIETYAESRAITNDITVRSGGVLTISTELFFAPGKGIKVERGGKLIVSDGVLTKCPYSENWKGISVAGNARKEQVETPGSENPGVVVTENARIEYAEIGIASSEGGLVISENTFFEKNGIGVVFSDYSNFDNKSRFENCEFICEKEGANLSSVYDIIFENCTFSGAEKAGIVALNSGFSVVDGCVFKNNSHGIFAERNKSRFRSGILIENSFFDQSEFGIVAEKIAELNISGNQFNDNNIGLMIEEESSFSVTGNSFKNHTTSIWLRTTGFERNRLDCNYYEGFETGILIWGNNAGLQFDFQQFELGSNSSPTSINIMLQGFRNNPAEIFSLQRKEIGKPLSNRFSGNRRIISNPDQFVGFTKPFTYYAPDASQYPDYVPKCSLNPPTDSNCSPNNFKLSFGGKPQSCEANFGNHLKASKNEFIDEHSVESLKLIPNPASHDVTVEIPLEFEGAELQIINLLGQTIFKMPNVLHSFQKISLENLSGVHFVRLTNPDGKHLTTKLLIQ